jgi:hypothetical protein
MNVTYQNIDLIMIYNLYGVFFFSEIQSKTERLSAVLQCDNASVSAISERKVNEVFKITKSTVM